MKLCNIAMAKACGWWVRRIGTAWAYGRHGSYLDKQPFQGGYLSAKAAWSACFEAMTEEQRAHVTVDV